MSPASAQRRRAQAGRAGKQHARVDVPRHAEHRAVDDVRVPDAWEVAARVHARRRTPAIDRAARSRATPRTRRPRCAELRQIGRRAANVGRKELLVGRRPRICWTRTRMPGFSRSKSRTSSCTTSPSRPIAQNRSVTGSSGARCGNPERQRGRRGRPPLRRGSRQREPERGHRPLATLSSHPPVKPAARSPRTTCGFLFITRQTRPLR